jgi:hypothetical protein
MGKDTPTTIKVESMESIEYDTNIGQDEEMKDVEHVRQTVYLYIYIFFCDQFR